MAPDIEEQFDTFDRQGNFLGTRARSRVHAEGLWHKSVNVFLFDAAQRLYIQRRVAHKDICGGCWDLSVAEHLQPGESWEAGALRGLKEELGVPEISLTPLGPVQQLCLDQPALGIFDHEFKQVFRATWAGAITPNPFEVDEVQTIELSALEGWIARNADDFTPWFLRDLATFEIFGRR